MREKTWTVQARDGANIFGVTAMPEVDRGRHVVMVHGLTGHPYEYQLKRVSDLLCAKGYHVHRLALYWADEGCRKLHECTLQTHSDDLNDVIEAKCKDAEKLFLIGHSYGGPTVMIANPKNAKAVSLWDPSFGIKECGLWDDEVVSQGEQIFLDWGMKIRVGKEIVEEGRGYTEEKCLQLSEQFYGAIQVVHASEGYYVKNEFSYHSKGQVQNERHIIEGTEHCFYEGDTCEELADKTITFFEKF